jgi:hypothetical protein
MFAIARIEKIKSLKQASVASAHNMRTEARFSKEVDQSRSRLNEILVGSNVAYTDIKNALPEKRRKNAVLAVEVLLTASPEYFAENGTPEYGRYDEEKMQAWKTAALNFAKAHWGDNLVNCALHLDEATPHLQMFVVPKREDGKLDARSLFDRQALIEMQDKYHEAVAHLGLKRGISADVSHREHEPVKDYYKRSKEPAQEPELTKRYNYKPLETLEPNFLGKVDADEANRLIAEGQRRIVMHAKAHQSVAEEALKLAEIAKAKDDEARKAKADYEKVGREAERSKIALDEAKARNRELADQLREIPIEQVLERLGAKLDSVDKSKWHTEAGTISTSRNDQRFKSFNNDSLKGRGAIDLVCKVRGYDFKTATKWLSDEFGSEKAIATYAVVATLQAKAVIEKTPSPSKVPEPVEQNWNHVRSWLTEIRKLPEKLIDGLHEAGRLFADRFKNAVFASKDGQSAEIVGTSSTPFKGKRGVKESMFSVGRLGKIAVCESAIDAISVMASGAFTGAISTAGTPSEAQYGILKQLDGEKIIAFDNDEKGDEFAKRAKEHGFNKRVKSVSKDWNDDLRAGVQADIKSQLETQKQKQISKDQSMSFSL